MSEVKTNKITSLASNNDITLDPDGTGGISLDSSVVINESGADVDFRVESDGKTHAFFVEGGGGTDGFIGLNESSPQKMLHITKNDSDGIIILDADGTTTDHQICFAKDYGTGGVTGGNYWGIGVDGSENRLVFAYDANAQASLSADLKVTINSSGELLVGAGSFSNSSNVKRVSAGTIDSARSSTSAVNHITFHNPNGEVGSIFTSSSSTSYQTSSDHRLKENVADMTGAINRVKQLAPKRFNFIADDSVTVDGFLAHEAQTVVPEAVSGTHNEVDDDGNAVMQGIDQSKLVPLLTAALKESITKIETLETENSTQATQIADLITRVTALENA